MEEVGVETMKMMTKTLQTLIHRQREIGSVAMMTRMDRAASRKAAGPGLSGSAAENTFIMCPAYPPQFPFMSYLTIFPLG